jgi:hypothetical protein
VENRIRDERRVATPGTTVPVDMSRLQERSQV